MLIDINVASVSQLCSSTSPSKASLSRSSGTARRLSMGRKVNGSIMRSSINRESQRPRG